MNSELSRHRPVLHVRGISHFFAGETGKRLETLKDISFSVRQGEFFVLLGPSGCGKSTLLRIIAGTIRPTRGEIAFRDGLSKDKISMIFQSFAIFPWLTVRENVAFGLKMKGVPTKEQEKIVAEHIHEIGLHGFENAYPKDLSGGMKQRVGIARALSLNPQLLLMDEPFSALDAFTAEKLRKELLDLWMRDKMTKGMVTHLVDEAVERADRILVMTPIPGKVEAVVPIDLPRPRNRRSPEFFALVDKLTEIVRA